MIEFRVALFMLTKQNSQPQMDHSVCTGPIGEEARPTEGGAEGADHGHELPREGPRRPQKEAIRFRPGKK